MTEKATSGDKDLVAQQQMSLLTEIADVKRQHSQARQDRMTAERRLLVHKE